VAVIGAAGGIGQPLSLLLKANPLIGRLALYDIVNTPGVAADLSHINTSPMVSSHQGPDQLKQAIEKADLILVPAGVPRKPGRHIIWYLPILVLLDKLKKFFQV